MSWLTTNIKNRLQNPNCDFEVYINKTSFEKVNFEQASDSVALSIANEKIFVGFSGGYDSEFIIRCLHRNKIPFTKLIWEKGDEVQPRWLHIGYTEGAKQEIMYTFNGKDYIPYFGSVMEKHHKSLGKLI